MQYALVVERRAQKALAGIEQRDATSDYLDVTDAQALRRLMLLAERGADVCVFQAGQPPGLSEQAPGAGLDGREAWRV